MTNELKQALEDIATPFGLTDEYASNPEPRKPVAGPSNWDSVGPGDFGPEHDFDYTDHGSIYVLDAVSEAALQWCYAKLPEDCPRWGARGFVIEPRYLPTIVYAMRRDNLMSRQDFEDAMDEAHNLALQWENQ